jgi:exodeoxyribonuclease-3
VHDPVAWAGQILCSEPERMALQRLLGLGLRDSFRLFEQAGQELLVVGLPDARLPEEPGTADRPHPALGERSPGAVRQQASSREVRKLERPSDHAPVTAEVSELSKLSDS